MEGFRDVFKVTFAWRIDSCDVRTELPTSLMQSRGKIFLWIVNISGIKRAGRTKESICKTIVRPNDINQQGVGSEAVLVGSKSNVSYD